ncbi:hypothetical protein SISNIDRAFT_469321 [Sistotremastrum niveocremeum HHB9708]|uniref:Uncharacterized protein n=1 Tax=Sistotremastrum niveocremeum HHB9708 TaxID=1314777 RepID=A0A164QDL2_9AGAM|nr:hypothetical protein SISNIDRAFT_469321 [Sistotremastrum niveocremeum HHB9708]
MATPGQPRLPISDEDTSAAAPDVQQKIYEGHRCRIMVQVRGTTMAFRIVGPASPSAPRAIRAALGYRRQRSQHPPPSSRFKNSKRSMQISVKLVFQVQGVNVFVPRIAEATAQDGPIDGCGSVDRVEMDGGDGGIVDVGLELEMEIGEAVEDSSQAAGMDIDPAADDDGAGDVDVEMGVGMGRGTDEGGSEMGASMDIDASAACDIDGPRGTSVENGCGTISAGMGTDMDVEEEAEMDGADADGDVEMEGGVIGETGMVGLEGAMQDSGPGWDADADMMDLVY